MNKIFLISVFSILTLNVMAVSYTHLSIRGIRSVASDNQPLYVIDGVPILNSTSEQAYSAICLLYTSRCV